MINICQHFRKVAFSTDDLLRRGAAIDFQHAEETITENILFEFAETLNPSSIFVRRFSKIAEGKNGADWEWWLTNSSRTKWLGMRIQAKIINHQSRKYEHFHYKRGKPAIYQSEKLKVEARKAGLIPAYCLYSYYGGEKINRRKQFYPYPYCPELYGCSIISVSNVEKLRKTSNETSYSKVMRYSFTWHCLVCDEHEKESLPDRAFSFLNKFDMVRKPDESSEKLEDVSIEIRRNPPRHVADSLEDFAGEIQPDYETDSTGIIVFVGTD